MIKPCVDCSKPFAGTEKHPRCQPCAAEDRYRQNREARAEWESPGCAICGSREGEGLVQHWFEKPNFIRKRRSIIRESPPQIFQENLKRSIPLCRSCRDRVVAGVLAELKESTNAADVGVEGTAGANANGDSGSRNREGGREAADQGR